MIFEINLNEQTVKCIHGRNTSAIGSLYDVQMTIESAKNFWLNNYIVEEDRAHTSQFFDQITFTPPHNQGMLQVLILISCRQNFAATGRIMSSIL
jgi:hypothetical protein